MKETHTETRPWGRFERLTHNEKTTVKIITVEANQQLSLQYHNHREEYWRVLEGKGEVVLGEETLAAKKEDEFFIPTRTKHRMQTKNEQMIVLEISYGEFDEEDIIRLEDKYGRN
ncbi:MAG: phosphomannose isomerase type II C-terminal cupin domain [Candidatus Woesearchaeota archaeon]